MTANVFGSARPEAAIDPATYRCALGHLPTGVTVVATIDSGRPVGLVVGSVFSVSLEPSLVGFCVALTSNTWPSLERTGRFAVSVLGDHQAAICRVMSTKNPDKFEQVPWTAAPATGSPYVDGAVASIDCELDERYVAGDHYIVVGRVRHLHSEPNSAGSLVFCRGDLGRHERL